MYGSSGAAHVSGAAHRRLVREQNRLLLWAERTRRDELHAMHDRRRRPLYHVATHARVEPVIAVPVLIPLDAAATMQHAYDTQTQLNTAAQLATAAVIHVHVPASASLPQVPSRLSVDSSASTASLDSLSSFSTPRTALTPPATLALDAHAAAGSAPAAHASDIDAATTTLTTLPITSSSAALPASELQPVPARPLISASTLAQIAIDPAEVAHVIDIEQQHAHDSL